MLKNANRIQVIEFGDIRYSIMELEEGDFPDMDDTHLVSVFCGIDGVVEAKLLFQRGEVSFKPTTEYPIRFISKDHLGEKVWNFLPNLSWELAV